MKIKTLIRIIEIELKDASKNQLLEVIHALNEIYKNKRREFNQEKIRNENIYQKIKFLE